ncbi:uncharacterized protein MEPE_06569 [Melanopsichium pennsylvanicum]|uniref:RING-type domain-containing protein n=2 Tax=Melanopsichium pennsylvanicum TaxID=63383 RepID=A0AAJ4XT17_9BASI|nr:fog: e3 ubiquitin ligase [Melanopsichium pennsylvanicum 4]SNX87858.1 uncharacterized protein MEPE_06569 [Melanopsichium pennsylvanicum]
MGHAQSRQQQRDDQHASVDERHRSEHSPSSASSTVHAANQSIQISDSGSVEHTRKRRRNSSAPTPVPSMDSSTQQRLIRRRRTSPHSDYSSTSATGDVGLGPVTHHLPPELPHDSMDVDSAQTTTNPPSASPTSAFNAVHCTTAHAAQSDSQQRYDAVQSRDDSSGVGSGATPPPHLDPLRDERERARRRILETISAVASAPAPTPPSGATASASAQNSTTSTPSATAGSPTHPLASATVAALIGAVATGRAVPPPAASQAGSQISSSATLNHTAAEVPSTTQSGTQQQQQQRPQAVRIPLQPEMISGTSMVVQGALVARTVSNRSTSSGSPSLPESRTGGAQSTETGETRPSPFATTSSGSAPTIAESFSGIPGATSDGTDMRGAVTLEEQAVMLSRILGIAAAATAASLLNTSESHHVDPSLLQTSLRRPFERMNQAPNNRDERWLADWQHRQPPSSNAGARPGSSSASGFGIGLRGRLAALSRRVQSASSISGLPISHQDGSNTNRASVTATPSQSATTAAARTNAADGGTADEQVASQQEIIAHLLSAAEREAASQRLSHTRTAEQPPTVAAAVDSARARSFSFSSSRPQGNTAQQEASRSSLSRLVRSTIGSFMHPGRLLPRRNSRSEGSETSDASRSAWSSASSSAGSSTLGDTSASEFSLGPNDVAGTLRQVRNGILPDGVPGSFGNFLNHLVRDLMAAVQLMRPSSELPLESANAQTTNYFEHAMQGQEASGAEVLDGDVTDSGAAADATGDTDTARAATQQAQSSTSSSPTEEDLEAQARRSPDFQNGNLAFFRLFRFDPVAPSQLVPCIVVGVRSLNVTERFGEEITGPRAPAPGPGREFSGNRQQTSRPTALGSSGPTSPLGRQRVRSEGPQATAPTDGDSSSFDTNAEELPASRFMLFVSGGRYPPNHPLLTSNPTTAGRDLMILMDLLSTMQAMQHKPSTVTQQEIDASDLPRIKGSDVAAFVLEGKITENMAERCLVCLEDWKDEDDCRVLACKHAFHATCVDRWLSSSSNTCPMCRRQGVAKDGRRAGDETADSRRAAQT